jgi:hypothetical protein
VLETAVKGERRAVLADQCASRLGQWTDPSWGCKCHVRLLSRAGA